MKPCAACLAFLLNTAILAHPGGGIVALSEASALLADPTENVVWQVERVAANPATRHCTRGGLSPFSTPCQFHP